MKRIALLWGMEKRRKDGEVQGKRGRTEREIEGKGTVIK